MLLMIMMIMYDLRFGPGGKILVVTIVKKKGKMCAVLGNKGNKYINRSSGYQSLSLFQFHMLLAILVYDPCY